jgi:hypothetical protein
MSRYMLTAAGTEEPHATFLAPRRWTYHQPL